MLTVKQIAVGLVTQAVALQMKDPKSEKAQSLLKAAGYIMAVEITGRRQI